MTEITLTERRSLLISRTKFKTRKLISTIMLIIFAVAGIIQFDSSIITKLLSELQNYEFVLKDNSIGLGTAASCYVIIIGAGISFISLIKEIDVLAIVKRVTYISLIVLTTRFIFILMSNQEVWVGMSKVSSPNFPVLLAFLAIIVSVKHRFQNLQKEY